MTVIRRSSLWTASALLSRSFSFPTRSRAAMPTLEETLQQVSHHPSRVFLLDGGTGEELFRRGVPDDRKIWSATAVVHPTHHATLQAVHRSFLQVGCQAVTTNSYGITPGVGFSVDEIRQHCATAGQLARQVVNDHHLAAFVLGSLGPLVESYRPDLILEHKAGVAIYQVMMQALAPTVDAFLAETLSSVEESMQPVDALAQEGLQKSILISYTLQSDGKLRSGEVADSALRRILDYADERNVKGGSLLRCCVISFSPTCSRFPSHRSARHTL